MEPKLSLPKEAVSRLPQWRATEFEYNPVVWARFYTQEEDWVWFLFERGRVDNSYYGLFVSPNHREFCEVVLDELHRKMKAQDLTLCVDMEWQPQLLSYCC